MNERRRQLNRTLGARLFGGAPAIGPMKFSSVVQKGLTFWVEPVPTELSGGSTCYQVLAQVEGAPSHQAWDDLFARQEDAEAIAEQLAAGKL